MKILYHHRTQGEEPESVHIASIVRALTDRGAEVDIIGPAVISRHAARGARLSRFKSALPRMAVELVQLAYNVRSGWQLLRRLRHVRYDFIYERYALYNVAGVFAARLSGLPLILEVNTLYAQAWGKYYGLAFPRLARAVERFTLHRADWIVTVTEVQRKLLQREGVRPERISVTHNAIDPNEFAPKRFDDARFDSKLKPRRIVVGFVGTMNRWQGVAGFADVIREVAEVRRDVGFLFVGDGEGREHLESRLRDMGLQEFATFVGRVAHAEVPRYLAAMDVGVLLDSNAYGSPMKVFEYWAMGKPVIAPRVEPIEEIMKDGETGFLIAPGDAKAMARCVITLASNAALRQRLGENGRCHVLETHTWSRNAEEILRSFHSCMAASQGAET